MLLEDPVEAPPLAGDRPVHRLAEGTEPLGEYQGSGLQQPRFLLRRSDGQVMQLPALLYRVACSLDGRRDDAELATQLSKELDQELTSDQVTFLVEERLRPAGVLAGDGLPAGGDPPDRPAAVKPDLLLALRYRVGVVPERVVWQVAGPLRFLFRRPAWLTVLTAFVVMVAVIFERVDLVRETVSGVDQLIREPGLVLAFLAIEVVAAVFHETGHVTACRYGGARPGDMGVGLYLVWPAFYSTVTDSYRLNRVGRLRTDLGGVYFNTLFLTCLGAVYLGTGQPWLLLVLLAWLSETVWQFLPSIRLDGYYILADLAGVPDLFGYVMPALKSLAPGRPTHPRLRELRPWPRRVIVGWVAATIPTLALYLVAFLVVVPRALPAAARELAQYGQELEQGVRAGQVVQVVLGTFQGFLLVLPWLGSALITVSVAGRLRRAVVARWGRGRLRPGTWRQVRRLLTVGGTGGLVALLVVRVWWVGTSLPASRPELGLDGTRLVGGTGGSVARPGDAGDVLTRQVASWLPRVGPSGPPAGGLQGARELAVLSTAALAVCLLALAVRRRTGLVSVVLPVVGLGLMGPAVSVLAVPSPALVAAACTAGGLLALGRSHHRHRRHRGYALTTAGAALTVLGIVLCPLLCLPLAAAAAVPLLRGPGPLAAVPRPVRAVVAVLLLCVAVLAVPRAALWYDGVLSGADRRLLLLVVGIVTVAGAAVRGLRPWAAAAAVAVLLAAVPWAGAGDALPLVVVTGTPLAVLLIQAVVGAPVGQRPHPLLRAAVAVPLLAVVVTGALFTPATAADLPHAALASWISGPVGPTTPLAVPPALAADLVRDGVPPQRLGAVGRAADPGMWTVAEGGGVLPPRAVARFGSGATTLTVLAPARTTTGVAAVQLAARQLATAARERTATGAALTAAPGLTAPLNLRLVLGSGGADPRLLRDLTALAGAHAMSLGEVPDPAPGTAAPAPLRAVLVTSFDGRPTTTPAVARELGAALAAADPSSAGPVLVAADRGVVVAW